MRIAMFTDSYRPQINGMVTSIELFTKGLREMGHEVHIFTPEIPGHKYNDKFIHTFKSIEFKAYKEYRIGLPFKLAVDSKINDINFDVVHVHSIFSIGVAGLAYAKYKGLPVVGTFHTMFSYYLHYFIKFESLMKIKRFKKFAENMAWKYIAWFYNRCNVVIAPSQQLVPMLKKRGIKNVIYIPTGIEASKKIKASKESLKRKYKFSGCKLILHVGRVTKEKNIDFIIDSLTNLLKSHDDAKLIITSDGPYRKQLENKAEKLKLNGKIIFTGYLPENQLNEFYKMSDIFVMASKSETQGLVLLEAIRNSLPSVVLDTPIISDFIRENHVGIISKKSDFSSNISKILYRKNVISYFTKRCNETIKKYDMKKCTQQLADVYSSLASNRAGSHDSRNKS